MERQKQEGVLDGFSSDEEFHDVEISYDVKVGETGVRKKTQEGRLILPPAVEIAKKVYPIQPDTVTGWMPRLLLPKPVPVAFGHTNVDANIKAAFDEPNQSKVCYLGPREENSYYLHMNKPYLFPYGHIKAPEVIELSDRGFVGNREAEGLRFDSMYESGNLDCAIRVAEGEYDLFMRPDTNTKGHFQWYNFKVFGAKKDATNTFHICNFQKNHSLYTRGMKPFVFSKRQKELRKIEWEQRGNNIRYEKKPLRFLSPEAFPPRYYRLSFEYTFEYSNDEVQICYCIPYTYSDMLALIDELRLKPFVKQTKLATSLGSLAVPLLTIGDSVDSLFDKPRKCVVASARTHPGESNGSYMMHGFLQFLCGNSPEAIFLRRNTLFKVVPMLNVDGVVSGNHRTGLSGKDFNREFVDPDKYILPEIAALKDLVVKSKKEFGRDLVFFLDLHGHSIKKNVFIYGPEYPIRENQYYECKIFPKMLGNNSKMFRYYSCVFRVAQCKETTARAILFKKLNIPFSYTIEASNGFYYDRDSLKNVPFGDSSWKEMGETVVKTIYQYCEQIISADNSRTQKMRERKLLLELKTKNRNVESRKLKLQNTVGNPRLLYKRQSAEFKSSMEPKVDTPPSNFQQMIEEIKHDEETMRENPEAQKESDDDISEGSSDRESEADDLPKDFLTQIYSSIKKKKLKGLSSCSPDKTPSYLPGVKTTESPTKEEHHFTILSDAESPPKRQHTKSSSTRVTYWKTSILPSKSVFPSQKKAKPRMSQPSNQLSSTSQWEEQPKPKLNIVNIESVQCKYLNITGESMLRIPKEEEPSFIDSLKRTYNYFKEKELVSAYASDSFQRAYSRTTRKSFLFRGTNTSHMVPSD